MAVKDNWEETEKLLMDKFQIIGNTTS